MSLIFRITDSYGCQVLSMHIHCFILSGIPAFGLEVSVHQRDGVGAGYSLDAQLDSA
jgi:hypothetical protein